MPAPANQTLNHLFRYQKLYLALLLLAILISPLLFRYLDNNFTLIGTSSYFYLSAAEKVDWSNFYQSPYHLFLSFNFTHNPFVYQASSLILGILSFLLLVNLTKKLKLSRPHRFFFLLFLVLSPAFIYLFTVLNHQAFLIFLSLLGFNFLFSKRRMINWLSFPVFALIPFFDVFSSALVLFFLAIYFYSYRDRKAKALAALIVIFTFLNILLKKYLLAVPLKQIFLPGAYAPQELLIDFFSDFGGFFGLSLFAILLAIFGFAFSWKQKKIVLTYPFLIIFLGLFFYQTTALIYLNFLIAFFASLGFTSLLSRKWKLELIKNLALLLLLLGLFFSTLTNLTNLTSLPPDSGIKESLLWLRDNLPSYQIIFSHPQDSYLIEYFSRKPAFLHYHDPDFQSKNDIAQQIFQSSYIKETFPLLEQNSLSHIYLSPQTRVKLSSEQGLIFLLQNERFKRLYRQGDIEIWEFR